MTTTLPIDLALTLTGRNNGERSMIVAGNNWLYGLHIGLYEDGPELDAFQLRALVLAWTADATATRKGTWNSYMATLRWELENTDNPARSSGPYASGA